MGNKQAQQFSGEGVASSSSGSGGGHKTGRLTSPPAPLPRGCSPEIATLWLEEELAVIERAFRKAAGAELTLDEAGFALFLQELPEMGLKDCADTPVAIGMWRLLTGSPSVERTAVVKECEAGPSFEFREEEEEEEKEGEVEREAQVEKEREVENVKCAKSTFPEKQIRVSLEELLLGLHKVLRSEYPARLALTLRVYDSDGDGLVGRDELEEFYLQTYRALMRRLRAQATPPQALHRQDSQQFQDKLVASLEGRFVAQVRRILDQLFLALDGDGDGKLQPQEFLLFLKSSPVVSAQYELHFLRDGSPSPKASAELHKVVSGTAPLSLLSAVSSFRSPPPSRLHRRSCPVVSSSSSSSHSSSTSTLAPLPPSSSSTFPSSKSTSLTN